MGEPHPGCTAIKRRTIADASNDRLVVGREGGSSVKFGVGVGENPFS